MAIKTTAVTVGTSATRIDTVVEGADHNTLSSVLPYNNGSQTVYIGGADVTTTNGAPIPAGTWGPAFSDVDTGEGIYGIVAATTAEVRVLEQGV